MLLEVFELLNEVGLIKREVHVSLGVTPGPQILQLIFEEGRDLSFIEMSKRQL